jgi:hypothetical protein
MRHSNCTADGCDGKNKVKVAGLDAFVASALPHLTSFLGKSLASLRQRPSEFLKSR